MIEKTEKDIMANWKGNSLLPLVTIRCLTYNHYECLQEALDSFLNQETDFPFEIIVHDDASTDGTSDILRMYANMFPNIIFPIIQTENQYSKHNGSIRKAINSKIRGKYVALCEGDDYWTDSGKLQIQIDYMKNHPLCVLSMHNGYMLNGKTNRIEKKINPYNKSGVLEPRDLLIERKMFPPTASMVYITEIEKTMPMDVFSAPVGDRPLRMYFLTKGEIHYLNQCMCAYRYNQGKGSFGTRVKQNASYARYVYESMISFYKRYNEYTDYIFSDEIKMLASKEEYNYYIRIGERDKAFNTEYFKEYYPKREALFISIRHIIANMMPESIVNIIKKMANK